MPTLRELSPEECDRLLRGGVMGRVAISTPDGPHLVPVNYSVVGDTLVIATSPYSVLGAYGPGGRAVFEIDDVDYERHGGWSVTAAGRMWVEDDAEELSAIRAVWAPRPWADGMRSLVLRMDLERVTGRRLGEGRATLVPPVQRTLG